MQLGLRAQSSQVGPDQPSLQLQNPGRLQNPCIRLHPWKKFVPVLLPTLSHHINFLELIVNLILRISNHLPFYIELHSNVPCKMFLGNHFCNCILTALCNIHLLLNNQVEGCSHHMSDPSILCDIFTKDVS